MKLFTKIIITAILCAVTALSVHASDAPTSPMSPIPMPKLTRKVTPTQNFCTEWATELNVLERVVDTWKETLADKKGSLVKDIILNSSKDQALGDSPALKVLKDEYGPISICHITLPTKLENQSLLCHFFISTEYLESQSNLHRYVENCFKENVTEIKPSLIHKNRWTIVSKDNKIVGMGTIRNIPLSDKQIIASNLFAAKEIVNKKNRIKKFMTQHPEDFPEKKSKPGTKRKKHSS